MRKGGRRHHHGDTIDKFPALLVGAAFDKMAELPDRLSLLCITRYTCHASIKLLPCNKYQVSNRTGQNVCDVNVSRAARRVRAPGTAAGDREIQEDETVE